MPCGSERARDEVLTGGPVQLPGLAAATHSTSATPCRRAMTRAATNNRSDNRLIYASPGPANGRSEEHTSELQSLMRISYAVFCLKKKTKKIYTRLNTASTHIRHTQYHIPQPYNPPQLSHNYNI